MSSSPGGQSVLFGGADLSRVSHPTFCGTPFKFPVAALVMNVIGVKDFFQRTSPGQPLDTQRKMEKR
jgi:hypothetical protein